MAALSVGSTLKASAMHCWATSIDSLSSEETVPSFVEFERKSIIARARRFFESEDCYV